MSAQRDVVIVGGGVGGGALATCLARAGLSVLVLEKTTEYPDLVRGEWIAPWGVVELRELELHDAVCAAGGHYLSRHELCEDGIPASAEAMSALDLGGILPGVPGPLCIRHPELCELLSGQAQQAGAEVLRGVSDVRVALDAPPAVSYRHGGEKHRVTCRIVVAADGRGSPLRKQAGIAYHRDPTHHLFAGMLIEGAEGWPQDLQVIGTAADVHFLVFPQGGGRVRLYLGYQREQAQRFAGAKGPRAFLEAFRLDAVPHSEHIANARPAGPCNSYPNEDTWAESVCAPGLVLLGDAAGSNDPIIGQGLSITLRDVRLVRDALLANADWTPAIFSEYARERAERMRRLRFSATLISTLLNEFGEQAEERRRQARQRMQADPTLMLPVFATLAGPHNVPPEAFDASIHDRLFGTAG